MSGSWEQAANIVAHRQTCAHEAGHLAAALALNIEPVSASAKMVDILDPTLEDRPDEPIGIVELPEPDGSRKSLYDSALIALAGKLYEGIPHWPPKWPLVAPLTPDEKQLGALVKLLGLDQRGYHDLLRDAYGLVCSTRFDRMASVASELLERHHHLDRRMIKAIKAAVDDDAERDEDGLVSDAQIEKDIEQLRQQEAEPVLPSMNGAKPKSVTAIREEARHWAFKSMSAGARVEIAEYEVSDEL